MKYGASNSHETRGCHAWAFMDTPQFNEIHGNRFCGWRIVLRRKLLKELELGLRPSVKECRCWTEWTGNQIRASLEMAVSV